MLKKISYEMNDKGMIMKATTMTLSTLNDKDDMMTISLMTTTMTTTMVMVNDDDDDDDDGDGDGDGDKTMLKENNWISKNYFQYRSFLLKKS